ncbi:hypothetical protein [Actinacidiphila soli]|uniref:hypothetical protein n=1 Tax=Actinacidiphila soli TaxID=2487275 RepID=UPI000FCAC6C7|nr:hypothetical protein [Actinacidiphila soli]
MTVRSIRGKPNVSRGAIATLAALALAFPVVTATTAQNAAADPKKATVEVKGKVGCDPVNEDFNPTAVEFASGQETVNAAAVNAAAGTYSGVKLTKVPKKGAAIEVTITCKNPDNAAETDSWTTNVTVTRPQGAGITRTVSLLKET